MLYPPFPPYTTLNVTKRFPDDPHAHEIIRCLRHWLFDQRPLAEVLATTSLSRRTLYRWRTRWEQEGLTALLVAPAQASRLRVEDTTVRHLLRFLAHHSALHIGCDEHVRQLLAHRSDPVDRGRRLLQILTSIVQACDQQLEAEHGFVRLLHRRFIDDEASATAAARHHVTERTVRRVLAQALTASGERCAALLDTTPITLPWETLLLDTPPPGRDAELRYLNQALIDTYRVHLVGLPGMGKSTIAAYIAQRWHHAGWNVCWISCIHQSPDLVGHIFDSLQRQLADIGAVSSPRLDHATSRAKQSNLLRVALQKLPILLVIDDVQEMIAFPEAAQSLVPLLQPSKTVRVLLVGRTNPLEGDLDLVLQGLPDAVAHDLWVQVHGALTDREWEQLAALHCGNPKLIRLIPRAYARGKVPTPDMVPMILQDQLAHLPSTARRLLMWLSWWQDPLPHTHPFARAAPGTSQAWQTLVRQHLISIQHEHILIHDLVRHQLEACAVEQEWTSICTAVTSFATRHRLWALAYRCAAQQQHGHSMLEYSRAAAQQAERQRNPSTALEWWRCAAAAADTCGDHAAGIQARLAEAVLLLHLAQREALVALQTFPPIPDPVQRWWHALYLAQAHRLVSDYATAEAVFEAPPLRDPPPAEIAKDGAWFLRLFRTHLLWDQGRYAQAVALFQQLGPPAPNIRGISRHRYYSLGARIARSRKDHRTATQFVMKYIRSSKSLRSPYLYAEAQMEYVHTLSAQQQYGAVRRRLRKLQPTLDESWTTLRRRAAGYHSLAAGHLGDLHAAESWCDDAWQLSQRLGWHETDAFVHWLRGLIAFRCGAYDTALQCFQLPTTANQRITRLLWSSRVAVCQGNHDQAAAYLEQSFHEMRRNRACGWTGDMRLPYGDLLQAQEQWDAARRQYLRGLAVCQRMNLQVSAAECLGRIAECLLALGRAQEALHVSDEATQILTAYPVGLCVAPRILLIRAQLHDYLAHHSLAHAAWQAALAHIQFQARHLSPKIHWRDFLVQPYYDTIVAHFGGADVVQAGVWCKRGQKPKPFGHPPDEVW
jgi:tetratricopeptide (TPR) repeat protein/nucleoside-triphosphatase THEP1